MHFVETKSQQKLFIIFCRTEFCKKTTIPLSTFHSSLCRLAIRGESGENPEQSGYCESRKLYAVFYMAAFLPKSEYLLLTLLSSAKFAFGKNCLRQELPDSRPWEDYYDFLL